MNRALVLLILDIKPGTPDSMVSLRDCRVQQRAWSHLLARQCSLIGALLFTSAAMTGACTRVVDDEADNSGVDSTNPSTGDAPTQNTATTISAEPGDAPWPDTSGSGSTGSVEQPTTSGLDSTASSTTNIPGCRDGEQRPCSETQAGAPIIFPMGQPVGSCTRGISTCSQNAWGPCIGAVAPKLQDRCEPGNDDNCNGKPTDHCACTAGEVAPCGESTGACEPGTMVCQADGSWGSCIGATLPRPELCDGQNIDEDCNGQADLQDPACECITNTVERCALAGQGDCALGVKRCFKGRPTPCQARFPKLSVEQCGTRQDGQEASLGPASGDENCNGLIDETDWASPRPTGCALYMMDKDQDGWGAVGQDIAQSADPSLGTWGCFCPSKIPAGWRLGKGSTVGKDCGDCLDGGAEVKPEQSIPPQKEPSRCLKSLGSATPFDYNCSGVHERDPKQAGVFKCEYIEGRGCVATGYWIESEPFACGEEAPYMTKEKHCMEGSGELRNSCISFDILLTSTARCN